MKNKCCEINSFIKYFAGTAAFLLFGIFSICAHAQVPFSVLAETDPSEEMKKILGDANSWANPDGIKQISQTLVALDQKTCLRRGKLDNGEMWDASCRGLVGLIGYGLYAQGHHNEAASYFLRVLDNGDPLGACKKNVFLSIGDDVSFTFHGIHWLIYQAQKRTGKPIEETTLHRAYFCPLLHELKMDGTLLPLIVVRQSKTEVYRHSFSEPDTRQQFLKDYVNEVKISLGDSASTKTSDFLEKIYSPMEARRLELFRDRKDNKLSAAELLANLTQLYGNAVDAAKKTSTPSACIEMLSHKRESSAGATAENIRFSK